MEDRNQSEEQIQLDSLPDELIAKIYGKCSKEDKKSLCLANKRFLNIYYRRPDVQFIFHMEHGFDFQPSKPFDESFKTLLNLKHAPIVGLKISGYEMDLWLKDCFSNEENGEELLFGKPLNHYLEESYACKNVKFVLLCAVRFEYSDIEKLLKLFPDKKNFILYRCFNGGRRVRSNVRILFNNDGRNRIGWRAKNCCNLDQAKNSSDGDRSQIMKKEEVFEEYRNDLIARLIGDTIDWTVHPGHCSSRCRSHSCCDLKDEFKESDSEPELEQDEDVLFQ